MPRNQVTRHRRSVTRYAPYARAAGKLVSKAYRAYKGSKGSTRKTPKGSDDYAPLYGSTFTSRVAYRSRRPNKKRLRFAKKSFRQHVNNAMKLQNAQNTLSQNTFTSTAATDNQQWFSLDMLNGFALSELIDGQVPTSVTGTPFTDLRDFQLMLKTFSLKYYITNISGVSVSLDIYHVRPRRNVTYQEMVNPALPTNGNVLSTNFVANTTAIPTHNDQLTNVVGDAIAGANVLGYTPFQYSNFCRVWKITKMRTVVLAPGATFEARDTVLNRMLNIARMGLFNTQEYASSFPTATPRVNFYIRGISRTLLFRQRGMPDSTSASPASGLRISWEETSTSKVMQTRPGSSTIMPSAA
ncbi:capsid protein [Blackfly DNA Virus 9]|nr:capsid protein [Blackfly DNA Virus 9]